MSDQPLMSAVLHDGYCSVVAPATPKRRRVSDPSVEPLSPSKKRRERARRTRSALWEKTRWSRHVDDLLADIQEEPGKEEDIEDELLLEDEGTLEPAFVETDAALDDIREKLVAARLTDGWRFLAGAARVEAMEHSRKVVWALERSMENLLRIWSVGEDDDERDAASRQISMTLNDHMDEKEDEEDEEDSEETEAAQRDTVTVTIAEIMLWSTETYLGAMAEQFKTKMRAHAALREELEGGVNSERDGL